MSGPAERVAVLSFDSAGISFLEAGLAAGRLPALAGMLDSGRGIALMDHQEIATSPSWASLIRGCDLPDHKLFADRGFEPGGYRVVDVYPESAQRPPFWRYLSDAGVPSVVLSPYSATLLDDFRGLQVSGWGSHDPFDSKLRRLWSDPPELIAELERHVGRRAIHCDATPPRGTGNVRAYVREMRKGCEQQGQALRRLLEMDDWGFAFAAFCEGHQAGHWLWHLADPEHSEYDPAVEPDVRDGLMRIYEATDDAIGAVLAALPSGTVVLIVSPYDMGPNHHLDEALPTVLERAGWLVNHPPAEVGARVRALRAGRRAVRAAVPLALRPALGQLAGRKRLLAELGEAAVDWPATKAMPIPGDGSSGVRLNLVGRERAGRVQPGAEAEQVLQGLTETLTELRCADSGRPVVARVVRYEEVFDAEPFSGPADLLVEWTRLPRPGAVRSGRVGVIPVPSERSITSVHRTPGFVVGAGPGIDRAPELGLTGAGEARLADVAPTVLTLLGVPVPPEITGRPIPGLVPAGAEAGA